MSSIETTGAVTSPGQASIRPIYTLLESSRRGHPSAFGLKCVIYSVYYRETYLACQYFEGRTF